MKRKRHRTNFRFLAGAFIVVVSLILCGALIVSSVFPKQFPKAAPQLNVSVSQNPSRPIQPKPPQFQAQQDSATPRTSYGHLPYAQANPKHMLLIASYATGKEQRFESLHPEAGKALMKMIFAARETGVWLVPVSGFRTISQQDRLFKDQSQRLGSPEAAAKLSAPPGYSEHHTGFAVDLADGKMLVTEDIKLDFEKTQAFDWLVHHAREFGFELSFPQSNSQGISYEPWHWRFVGSPKASMTFAMATRLKQNAKSEVSQ